MNNKRYIISAVIVIVLIIIGLFVFNGNGDDTSKDVLSNTNEGDYAVSVTPKAMKMSEVYSANTEEKCYTVINNSVYDLTGWIKKHPGGSAAILNICGKDGTAVFGKKHGGQALPEATLAKMKIGWIEVEAVNDIKG